MVVLILLTRVRFSPSASPAEATATKKKKQKVKKAKPPPTDLLHADIVVQMATELHATPAQLLLRWALEQDCILIPKTTSVARMEENAAVFNFTLSVDQCIQLEQELMTRVEENTAANNDGDDGTINDEEDKQAGSGKELTRLCWRRDPLRHLDFD